ncbi:hypothetical protein F4782DRAFT_506446 [Xylaria castorea]|nr:hypothetical protein F4782DRAFT_506446 [Xylaria castorea]
MVRDYKSNFLIHDAWALTRREPRWTNQDMAVIGNTGNRQGVHLSMSRLGFQTLKAAAS